MPETNVTDHQTSFADHRDDGEYHRRALMGSLQFMQIMAAAGMGYSGGLLLGVQPLLSATVLTVLVVVVSGILRARALRRLRAEIGARQNAEYERRWKAGASQ